MIESFMAFGAEPPRCYRYMKLLERDPWFVIRFKKGVAGPYHLLAVDFAEHAVDEYLSDNDPPLRKTLNAILRFARWYYGLPYRERRSDRQIKRAMRNAQQIAERARKSADCRMDLEWTNIDDREGWREPLEAGDLEKPAVMSIVNRWPLRIPFDANTVRDVAAQYRAATDASVCAAVELCLRHSKKAFHTLRWTADEAAYASSLAAGYFKTRDEAIDLDMPEREWQRRKFMRLVANMPKGSVLLRVPRRRGRFRI
jgi:hypothetical protein